MELTPRERIHAALRGEWADRVPFTVYWLMFPRGDVERRLRNQGVAVVERVPVYRVEMPNVQVISHEYFENGVRTLRETVRTPVGEVYAAKKLDPNYGTSWWYTDYYIKQPQDYRVVEFMVRDTRYAPNDDAIRLAQERMGEDGYVIGTTDYSPMNKLMIDWLGSERFGMELYDHPDEFFSLYERLREKQRAMYPVAAGSPAGLLLYGGNIHEDMIGPRRFEQYYIPCFNEFADAVHEQGKLCACHLDAKMGRLVQAVAQSRIDVVEAFTPVPTCDVTVSQARAAWPDKVLWINFPSSVHAEPVERIREETLRILHEAAPGDRFLIGITEDIPENAWRASLSVISHTVLEHGALPIRV
jgi:uroporphyrinogen-III decarboxylase